MSAVRKISLPPAWSQRWTRLGSRQKNVILAGAAVLVAAWFVAYVWLPMQRGRSALTASLPELRAQLAELKRQSVELQHIRSAPPIITSSATTRNLDAQLLRAAFTGTASTVTPLDGQRYRLTIADTAYVTWLDELNRLQGQTAARVDEATLTLLAPPGRIQVDAVLSAGTTSGVR